MSDDVIKCSELHNKVWGIEEWIANNDMYCGKILHLSAKRQCSLHYHLNKHETFYILEGFVQMEWKTLKGDVLRTRLMVPGESITIYPCLVHRFTGLTSAKILEVSTHHEESDSYRLEESRAL